MDPITDALIGKVVATGYAKVADMVFTLALAGFEREPIVTIVRDMEAAGARPDEITEALQTLRHSEESKLETRLSNDDPDTPATPAVPAAPAPAPTPGPGPA